MRKGRAIPIVFWIILLLISEMSALSQTFSVLYDFVDNKQKKSIDKALKDLSEAGKLTQEANDYYNEALALQSNYELDEKTLQKKLAQAEEKAVSLQIKADKLYASAYESLYELCQEVLNQSVVSYGEIDNLKNAASDMMNNAAIKREEAKDNKNAYEKAALLNDAAGFEAAAIDNLILAIQIQNGVAPSEPTQTYTEEPYAETPTVSTYEQPGTYDYSASVDQKSENLAIDQNRIEKYQEYLNDPTVPEPIVINRSGIVGVDDISVENARNIFHNYHMGSDYTFSQKYSYTPDMQTTIEDSISQLALLDQESQVTDYGATKDVETENKIPDVSKDYESEDRTKYKEQTLYTESRKDIRAAYDLSSIPQASDINFMVQVAASRVPLNRAQLWAIFPGNFTVEVMQEDEWYKYRVTGFRLYSEANRVALESGVRDAWVVSYQQGKSLNLVEAREMTRVMETDVKRYGRKKLENPTDFYVQVVASRIRLSEDQISQFCGTINLCREVIEEGWFKYQLYAGNEYSKAVALKDQIGGDSFVVAYERGTKVNLHKATNRNK